MFNARKYLGIYIDGILTVKEHINKMTQLTAYIIYKVFLLPLLDYFVSAGVAWCILRWRNMSNMKGLKREQHRL